MTNIIEIMTLGFTEKEVEEIENQFLCRISMDDWELMETFESSESLFKSVYIDADADDKELLLETVQDLFGIIKESSRESKDALALLDAKIENEIENSYKLSSGKWVVFPDELMRKEQLAQID